MNESPAYEEPAWVAELRKLREEDALKYAGHQFDEDGWHDEDECRVCLEKQTVVNSCRCGECCRRLLIEVDVEDAEHEPKIKELGSPIYHPAVLTGTGRDELIGYLLNRQGEDVSCVFLSEQNLCSIHPTRPLVCRLFNCDDKDRDDQVELGVLPPR
jgi:Fe-S-cluster containining protein